ncbi:MAG: hypothetical protein L0154_16210 [Chloroflexi bacterium]|nr:hypothetical protein [Chloroflexota bacterium]
MTQTPHRFEAQITQTVQLDYLVYLPPGYDNDPDQRWPVTLFLHGAGGRGSDLELVKRNAIPHMLENGHDLPFVSVSGGISLDTAP